MKTRRQRAHDPFALGSYMLSLGYLAAEAQAVIAMRTLGMAGFWPVTKSENRRMVDEKLSALTQAQTAMWVKAVALAPPTEVMAAGLRPLRRTTRANAARLGKRGVKRR